MTTSRNQRTTAATTNNKLHSVMWHDCLSIVSAYNNHYNNNGCLTTVVWCWLLLLVAITIATAMVIIAVFLQQTGIVNKQPRKTYGKLSHGCLLFVVGYNNHCINNGHHCCFVYKNQQLWPTVVQQTTNKPTNEKLPHNLFASPKHNQTINSVRPNNTSNNSWSIGVRMLRWNQIGNNNKQAIETTTNQQTTLFDCCCNIWQQ